VYTGINTLIGFSILGAVAHLGERIPCTDEVAGSIPVSSTTPSLPTLQVKNIVI
ncbi:uncharacterized protein METZ01_LOCUS492042, partial [marine metagenome]